MTATSTTRSAGRDDHRRRWADIDIARVVGWVDEPSSSAVIRALTDGGEWDGLGYDEAADRVRGLGDAIAYWLTSNGYGADTPVAVIAPTAVDTVIAYWAVLDSGAALVPLSPPGLGEAEAAAEKIAGILDVSGAPLVLASEDFAPLAQLAKELAGSGARIVSPAELAAEAGQVGDSAADRDRGEIALLQFTSGSTGSPRGVVISWEALAHNLDMIAGHVGFEPGDGFCSWLPMFHDMGLVGIVLLAVSTQSRLELMRPDQFIRWPERYVEMLSRCQHSASPSFGLGYAAYRLRGRKLPDVDLSGFKSLVIGSEPLRAADISGFLERFGELGFAAAQIRPAYGLAESTLMSCGTRLGEPMRALALSPATEIGRPAAISDEWSAGGGSVPGADATTWSFCVGVPDADAPVTICDPDGAPLPAGTVGEICVAGPSIADGYVQASSGPVDPERTRFDHGVLRTGDAGFFHDGGLYVLGRIGTSLKTRGRTVFMEDLDAAVAHASGLPGGRVAAAAAPQVGGPKVLLALETPRAEQADSARTVLRALCGDREAEVREVPRGFIPRTSSGKPRRHELIRLFAGSAEGVGVSANAGRSDQQDSSATPVERPGEDAREYAAEDILALWEAVAPRVDVPAAAGVLHEGSLAEGFGNARSDVDFLVVIPGDPATPTMPTVLFEAGRRVEVRTRSEAEIRAQFDRLAVEADAADDPDPETPGEDILNRCQRLAGSKLVRASDVINSVSLPHTRELAGVLGRWWRVRAESCRARAVAARALGNAAGEAGWMREAGVQALKAELAGKGETYLESKWLAEQLRRAGDVPAAELLGATGGARAGFAERWAELAGERLGTREPSPAQLRIERVPEVTTWIIGSRVHVVRGREDVFVLTSDFADAWRRVVPGRSLAAHLDGDAARAEVLEWALDLGLVRLSVRAGQEWREVRPAMSMVAEAKAVSPPPATSVPALTLAGATTANARVPFIRSALRAEDFAACGMALVWSLMVTENAREDLDGALRSAQWGVASAAAARVVLLSSRLVLTSCGVYPLPADVQPARSLRTLCPPSPDIDSLAVTVDKLLGERTSAEAIRADPEVLTERIDELVRAVRELTIGAGFPSSFDGPGQWNATLKIAYDWLRLGGYLDATLPLDEARDLVESGGQQPHAGIDTTEGDMP